MKRLLVLTSATGAGHDTHALATAAWCAQLYGTYVPVTIAHALEESHVVYKVGVDFYNLIQRRAPWFHHVYYNAIEMLDAFNPGTVGLGRAHIVRLLEATRPDAILSVHDCLNRGYFELARQVLGPRVRCATYCPEFEGGYGFSRNWVNPRGDFFFGRTAETSREAQRRGAAHAVTAGHWAPPGFYDPPAKKSAEVRRELGLDADRFTLLLSTGGASAQNHRALLRALRPLHGRLQVIALCGHDERARKELETWAARETSLAVACLGFTRRMTELLGAASVVVARAGATTAGEALLCGCPVIFNGLGGMMPQELPTWRWFRAREIGVTALTAGTVREHVTRWLERPHELAGLRERALRIRDGATPQAALEMLLQT